MDKSVKDLIMQESENNEGFKKVHIFSCTTGMIETPVIGESGNWFIGKNDTGLSAQGPQGETGPQGPVGPKGDKGDQGETGPQGPVGPKGDKGDQGDTGSQGPIGPKGDKGDQGDIGLQGPVGAKGDKGDQGDTGLQGPVGPKGDKGDTGLQGPKGDKGEQGPTGSSGIPPISSTSWKPFDLQESFEHGTNKLMYRRSKAGVVHINGVVTRSKIPTTGMVIATLPEGFRPVNNALAFPVVQGNSTFTSYVNISATSGNIAMWNGTVPNTWTNGEATLIDARFDTVL